MDLLLAFRLLVGWSDLAALDCLYFCSMQNFFSEATLTLKDLSGFLKTLDELKMDERGASWHVTQIVPRRLAMSRCLHLKEFFTGQTMQAWSARLPTSPGFPAAQAASGISCRLSRVM
jgi:hypothetical protein